MTIVLNSSTGITTPPVSVQGSTSGTITLVAPAVAGDNTQTLAAATGTLVPFNTDTAKTAPPTVPQYFDFTGIPPWVRRITVMFSGVSTSGTSIPIIQLGDSGGIEITGYVSTGSRVASATAASSAVTAGFAIGNVATATAILDGSITLSLFGANRWVAFGGLTDSFNTFTLFSSGGKTLSDTLTQIRITTVGGSDTFDAGSINLLYE